MRRRAILAGAGCAFPTVFAGCLDATGSDNGDGNAGIGEETDVGTAVERRAKECEKQHIRTEIVTGDETIDDSLEPTVTDTEIRDDGEFVALRTEFGGIRESDEAPDEHIDYLLTAYYLFTDETVYRTDGKEAEGDPRDGIRMDCDPKAGDENTNGNDTDEMEYSTGYHIVVGSPTEGAETEAVCEFEELPDGAQTEFLQAIEGVDFESEDHARREVDRSPELLETDCYPGDIKYEGEYYSTVVMVSSG